MKKCIYVCLILSLILFTACENKTKANVIRIGYTGYSFDTSVAYVIKGILSQQTNLVVELYQLPDSTMFSSLAEKELDIAISAWLPNTHRSFIEKFPYEIQSSGVISDSLGLFVAVPGYAPLSSIEDLKRYSNLLKNNIIIPESQNAIYALGQSIIHDYDLENFKLQEMSWDNILTHIEDSLNRTSGFAIITIKPHWIYKRYNIKTLSDHKKTLGDFEYASIYVNNEFSKKVPVIADFLSKIKFSIADIEDLMEMNQTLGTEPYENAMRWIEKNNRKVNRWLISE